ncbi:hydroxymethylglutaryl-CoA synthase family protein [Flavobacterium okayamense]|uniref:Hydroxymethylglutaryl-CoA synthase n=1 Tax=Flavobacterium okayamense TaxID=2830782 RepID=A0ABN6HXK4_9FLAO|nr:hydroxymethylglutaryl-CoA synthase [Flavobacterium okayamense]BCY29031.1 hydroxymethylglutaryl-CoA synthase [Flavobacterium okayamense]
MQVGIDVIQFDVPKIFLPIKDLANARVIEQAKLEKGLGLLNMSLLDVHQDVITLAANAIYKLIEQENIQLEDIARIYVGTESGLDNSKPIASYLVSILENELGKGKLKHCDVVDLTFACIGGVDAFHNCLDFIRLNPSKKAIVVTTDNAKYDLNSTGEYTQGAGAIAMLIASNPRILSINQPVGISTEGVFDFFKPKQTISKELITSSKDNPEWLGVLESEITIVKEQPIFDGQYSNECYINRIKEAYQHFKVESNQQSNLSNEWELILMHLPYCYQGRRTFIEIFSEENSTLLEQQEGETLKEKTKALSKSPEYLEFVTKKLYPAEVASGNIGNIYTGSIFLGLLSALYFSLKNNRNICQQKVGFIAYGSGSKSKVFEGNVQDDWKAVIEKTNLFQILESRTAIDFTTYEKLHKKELTTSIIEPKNEFVLDYIETKSETLLGARYYNRK